MEPGNNSEKHEQDFIRYQELKDRLNKEMDKWTEYSEEVEEFLRNNN